ncbi:MAG: TlyA family RNA methyltransferase [Syntrophomonadaceae bacterium]
MVKTRLDTLISQKGLTGSREKARAMILAGEVTVNGVTITKPGTQVSDDAEITITSCIPKYVSRGGLKLEQAIKAFAVEFQDKIVLDIGASTGGFTDCALKHGARKVYAVDVGYGQLDWSLRNDKRVVNLERTNIRYLSLNDLGERVDIITIDVSFISTAKVFPVAEGLLKEDGKVICLVKPQFEAGRGLIGKNGVVRDPSVHREVLGSCIESARKAGLYCTDITYSPITGPKGNIEFLLILAKSAAFARHMEDLILNVVKMAHRELGGKK